jgi:outer membrane protein OmpA-like peptidoglycan-associated protein
MRSQYHLVIVAVTLAASFGGVTGQESNEVIVSDAITDALTQQRTRGLGRAIGVRTKAKVDLNIPFEVNSSNLALGAHQQLEQLVDALSRDSLAESKFEIAGHTDASGAAEYNRKLSEQRAKTVMQYLIESGVDPARLVAVGYGEDMLLVTEKPEHPDNRRVEIRNLGASPDN